MACENNFAQIVKEMSDTKKKIVSNPTLIGVLESPVLPSFQKMEALHKTLNLTSISGPCKNFFEVLAENRRLSHTLKILNVFEDIIKKHNNLTVIEIISAEVRVSR